MGANEQINTAEVLQSQSIAEQLMSMEKCVRLFQVVAGLRSNRTGNYCDGLPVVVGWFETSQQAQLAYCAKYPQCAATDLRGVWDIKVSQIM